jgi:hypothetical protein
MNTTLLQYENKKWFNHPESNLKNNSQIHLVLCFGDKEKLRDEKIYASLKQLFPNAEIVISSTAGEIYQNSVRENSIMAVAIEFNKTIVRTTSVNVKDFPNSFDAAIELRKKLPAKDLAYLMVFSDGAKVNGSEMVKGLQMGEENHVLITGGLAGDGTYFKSTLVGLNEEPTTGSMLMIGFYGNNISVSHGSQGGWEMFGLEKTITRSAGNILHDIDDHNALELYKKYLGPEADHLPKSALLFPLSVTLPGSTIPVVRTILSLDENEKSMIFAGDVPVGSKVRFMKANLEKIIMAAGTAASKSVEELKGKPNFALLVSCVGRKLVLGARTEEEIEAVSEVFGKKTVIGGFYSYGEVSPFDGTTDCQLHNQTMTITTFYEIP